MRNCNCWPQRHPSRSRTAFHTIKVLKPKFTILLPDATLQQAQEIAERVRHGVERLAIPHESLGYDRVVGISIGVAATTVDALSLAELLRKADMALYAAKNAGRNRIWPSGECAQTVGRLDHPAARAA